MKGTALTLLVLIMGSEIFFCAAGALKVWLMQRENKWEGRERNILLTSLGIMSLGILIDRVLGMIALFYRTPTSKLQTMLQIIQLDLDFGKIPEALIALIAIAKVIDPTPTYMILVLMGRVGSALCAGAAIWFLFYTGLPIRRNRTRAKPKPPANPPDTN